MNTTESSYWVALELNNEGVSHLEAGRFLEARSTFQSCLLLMKVALSLRGGQRYLNSAECTQMTEQYQIPGVSATTDEWIINRSEFACPINGVTSALVTRGAAELDSSGPFIYKRAFRIYHQTTNSLREDILEYSAVILYNYALAHHLEGTPSRQGKARSYYQFALTILGSQRLQLDANRLIATAILNNLGQVCHELCDFCASERCFGRLRAASLADDCMRTYFDASDWQGLLTNLLLLVKPSLAAAA